MQQSRTLVNYLAERPKEQGMIGMDGADTSVYYIFSNSESINFVQFISISIYYPKANLICSNLMGDYV